MLKQLKCLNQGHSPKAARVSISDTANYVCTCMLTSIRNIRNNFSLVK